MPGAIISLTLNYKMLNSCSYTFTGVIIITRLSFRKYAQIPFTVTFLCFTENLTYFAKL